MPALLLESLEILHTFWKEHSIQVHIDQIIEILNSKKKTTLFQNSEDIHRKPHFTQTHFYLCICGGNRVACPVRIGECVEKSVQAPFQQFHKRLFQRVFPGPTQHTMLQNVWNSSGIISATTNRIKISTMSRFSYTKQVHIHSYRPKILIKCKTNSIYTLS